MAISEMVIVVQAYGDSYTTGDIIGIALDCNIIQNYIFQKMGYGKTLETLHQVQQEQEQYQLLLLQIHL